MAQHERQEIAFLDEHGDVLGVEDVEAGAAEEVRARRRARLEQWLPDGGGAALTALVFVAIAWFAAQPLVAAVNALVPQGRHRIGPPVDITDAYSGGPNEYIGVTPGLIPVISYGVRALLVLLALVFALRARRRERSAVATAALTTSSVSLALFVLGGVAMSIGLALGHAAGVYGVPY